MVKVGIIGGSGLDDPKFLDKYEELDVQTEYGNPSSKITSGLIGEVEVAILARHGKTHSINPSNVNYKANIYALKKLGCTHVIATTACGSLKEEIRPGDLVFLDQFIDRTTKRHSTFFDNNEVFHLPASEPFCNYLRNLLIDSAQKFGLRYHKKGTVVTIEGPRFSTKAESHMFRQWNADVVNMSTVPEVNLAREIGLCYASIAMSTDYDCWKEGEEPVTFEIIVERMKSNSENVKKLILDVLPKISEKNCCHALQPLEKIVELDLKSKIRTVPHWPKQGVMFRDITSLLEDGEALRATIKKFVDRYRNEKIDKVVGIDSRGFIFGSILAHELGIGFVPVRKPGKLPPKTIKEEYELEYGKDALEIREDSIKPGENVVVVDDLCATGGTLEATAKLVEKLGGNVIEIAYVIDLPELKGKERLEKKYKVYHIMEFEGE